MEFLELIHAKINGLWWGPNMGDDSSKNKVEWSVMCAIDDFVYGLVACESCFMFIYCTLTSFLDSVWWLVAKVRTRSHSSHSLLSVLILTCACLLWVSIVFLTNCHDCCILLVETDFRDLEECYGLYRTFPISNLTSEPNLIFHIPLFPK